MLDTNCDPDVGDIPIPAIFLLNFLNIYFGIILSAMQVC